MSASVIKVCCVCASKRNDCDCSFRGSHSMTKFLFAATKKDECVNMKREAVSRKIRDEVNSCAIFFAGHLPPPHDY